MNRKLEFLVLCKYVCLVVHYELKPLLILRKHVGYRCPFVCVFGCPFLLCVNLFVCFGVHLFNVCLGVHYELKPLLILHKYV